MDNKEHQGARPRLCAPRRICPPLGSTPAGLTPGGSVRRRLPDDLVRQASRRLEAMALLGVVLWTFCAIVYHLIDMRNAGNPDWMSIVSTDAFAVAGVAMSLALYFYLRRATLNPRFVLDL